MDPVTQGALGAACSQAILHGHDKRNAWLVGALGGMAADLDLFIRSSQDPMLFFIYHRQFTHSLSFIPIGGLLVALVLLPFKRFRLQWRWTLLAALIGYATHALLDACTSYGTVLFWPFSERRVAWDVMAIIDPLFTIPLILGIVWTVVFDNRRGVLIGLMFAGLLLMFNVWQHHRAVVAVSRYAYEQQWNFKRLRAFPDLASSTQWRTVTYINGKLLIADVVTPLFNSSKIYPVAFFPDFGTKDLPNSVDEAGQQRRDYNVFDWFTDGYLIAARQQPLVLVDARYLTGYNPLVALWGIRFDMHKTHVDIVRSIHLDDGHNLHHEE
ncbi:metal-dependent hydrolase [Legionella oakridgensis]|uniref:Integral membrane protein n=2 Tax=Legionella oakridgensis TaxID=29423 RepID=A0A0W0WZW9_9GAMM|nr:metal-dependent hydrolase [Legionella oakridgensis]AHE66528.1 putative membrane-bound metal-dependent hydrolase [Legionella oakridgensis ATCC 33761 = DSM 21215]KTD37857.1 integral membrane protein [Legionella oakridgensis]STY19690.1 membrane-bound metal-dependent hydrolase [Legionella longbeachae]